MPTPEQNYINHTHKAHRQQYAQVFTPPLIADMMAQWITRNSPQTILDPAIGTGVFARSLRTYTQAHITAYDKDALILNTLSAQYIFNLHSIKGDFIKETLEPYDAVIANPPYIRHHDCDKADYDIVSNLVRHPISKMANLYVLFIMKACHYLNEGGRAAFLIPSEWYNSNYGALLKTYLVSIGLCSIVHFKSTHLVFNDVLTTANILLIEKCVRKSSIQIARIKGTELSDYESLERLLEEHGKAYSYNQFMQSHKWNELFSIQNHTGFLTLGDIGASKRGIATGNNKYFLLTEHEARYISPSNKKYCVGKANDIKSTIITSESVKSLVQDNKKCVLLDFGNNLSEYDKKYIKEGEERNIQDAYILKHRKPWYSMEQRTIAPIFVSVFFRNKIKFIYNQARIANLTCFHGFYPKTTNERDIKLLVSLLNSELWQDSMKQHVREYGDGLMKLEPRDILNIRIPDEFYDKLKHVLT